MNPPIRIQLLTLAGGHRVLRLEHDSTGLTLERKLHPEQPVVKQKARLLQMFEMMLESELAPA